MPATQKQKKVTVKFFLNKMVEPVLGEEREKNYPLYVQVTYNRKNIQDRSHYGEYFRALNEVKPALLKFEEKIIRMIISYEAGVTKGEYELKGLKRKYVVYSMSDLFGVEAYIKPNLRLAILKTGSELNQALNFIGERVTTALLYKAARLLFPDLKNYVAPKVQEELGAYSHYLSLYKNPILTNVRDENSNPIIEPGGDPNLIEWVFGETARGVHDVMEIWSKEKKWA